MGAEYLSYVKSIATFAPTFYGYIISVLVSVIRYHLRFFQQLSHQTLDWLNGNKHSLTLNLNLIYIKPDTRSKIAKYERVCAKILGSDECKVAGWGKTGNGELVKYVKKQQEYSNQIIFKLH